MESVRQTIDANLLKSVIPLPNNFQNKELEVIIFLKEERAVLPPPAKTDIDAMLKGSVAESLIGVLPASDMTLQDYRFERLNKYERVN